MAIVGNYRKDDAPPPDAPEGYDSPVIKPTAHAVIINSEDKQCVTCKRMYLPTSPNQKRCPECRLRKPKPVSAGVPKSIDPMSGLTDLTKYKRDLGKEILLSCYALCGSGEEIVMTVGGVKVTIERV